MAPVIGGDESRWPLLDGGTPRWRVWCLASPKTSTYGVLEGRSKEEPASQLDGYTGEIIGVPDAGLLAHDRLLGITQMRYFKSES